MKIFAPLVLAISLFAASAFAAGKKPFNVKGEFLDSCSCAIGCSCVMGTIESGCKGVGVISVKSGSYGGSDISGAKIAYAVEPGKWVRGYVDAPDTAKVKAASDFAAKALAVFGKVEFVMPARISVSGSHGSYSYAVDGGKIMKVSMRPVVGGDGRSPIIHKNLKDPLNDKFAQAKTVSGSYRDRGRSFALKGTNSYYIEELNKTGSL